MDYFHEHSEKQSNAFILLLAYLLIRQQIDNQIETEYQCTLQATEMSLWEFMSLVKNHTPAREVMATTATEAAGLTIDEGIISKHLMKPSDPVR